MTVPVDPELNAQDVALVISVRCYDCSPEEVAKALEKFNPYDDQFFCTENGGEYEILDANVLFPRRTDD
jgi:hypothetical protein